MTRFLAYTNPLLGHVYPTVPTLLELRRRGHDVVLFTAAAAAEPLDQLGVSVRSVDPELERIENDDWKARTPLGAQKRDVANLARRARLEVPDLERAIEAERPDALIVDVTAFGASTVAERSGLPWAHVVHFPVPVPSRDAPPYGLGLTPRHDTVGTIRDSVARRLVLGQSRQRGLDQLAIVLEVARAGDEHHRPVDRIEPAERLARRVPGSWSDEPEARRPV